MDTVVLLIRHGVTNWTEEDRFTGVSNIPLSEIGLNQAQLLSNKLFKSSISINAIYSSPLQRCIDTAKIIAQPYNLDIQIKKEFSELNYGDWEGLSRREILQRYPNEFEIWKKDPFIQSPPKGESGKALIERALPMLTTLLQKHIGELITIVAHKALNRLLLCWALGIPYEQYRQRIVQYPACLNVFKVSSNGAVIIYRLNETSHYSEEILLKSIA